MWEEAVWLVSCRWTCAWVVHRLCLEPACPPVQRRLTDLGSLCSPTPRSLHLALCTRHSGLCTQH